MHNQTRLRIAALPQLVALCEMNMKRALTILAIILSIGNAHAEDSLKLIGKFQNVKATETGHCFGEGIDVWATDDNKIIGLLHIAQGLCGDPACSVITGSISDKKLSLDALFPIYNEKYSFSGTVDNTAIKGSLNNKATILNIESSSQYYQNKTEWCSAYTKVTRCKGVKSICK